MNKAFKFKHFDVYHNNSTMKVGTDAVVLAISTKYFTEGINNNFKVLEIGTGCGLISLIIAQLFSKAIIHAIDIDKPSIEEANLNFSNSPWALRLTAIHQDVIQFAQNNKNEKDKYDLIISNPPYFVNSMKAKSERRNLSSHNDKLSFPALASSVNKLLNKTGKFIYIMPNEENKILLYQLSLQHLYEEHKLEIYNKAKDIVPKRIITVISKQIQKCSKSKLIIYDKDNKYTDEYKKLVADFLFI